MNPKDTMGMMPDQGQPQDLESRVADLESRVQALEAAQNTTGGGGVVQPGQ